MNNYLKIALLSLVCASMSGSFTSCKDYDDDINNLQEQINQNKDAITSINNQIAAGAILNSVTKSADGKGIVITVTKDGKQEQFTITNGENGKDADVWTIGTDGYWYKNNEKTSYKAVGTDGTNGTNGTDGVNGAYYKPNPETGYFELYEWDAATKSYKCTNDKAVKYAEPTSTVETYLTAVDNGETVIISGVKQADGTYGTVTIAKNGALRGLVFIPDLYLDGVEATRYAYAPSVAVLSPITTKVTGTTYYNGAFEILAKEKNSYTATTKKIDIPSISTVTYELNPTNANVGDLAFSMFGTQKEAINRAANDPVFLVQGQPARNADNNLTVSYKISNPNVISTQENLLTVFATEAAAKEGDKETVTSDYATLVPSKVLFTSLAYAVESQVTTTMTCNKDLYLTGKTALENKATVDAVWDGGTVDLASKLCVHYLVNDFTLPTSGTHKVMTLKDAAEIYGLTPSFELVKYNVGGNDTNEDQYGQVSAEGVFTPCYVNAQGQTVPNTTTEGKSSIDRRPMVLVTLQNTQGEVVLNGYVVFEITAKKSLPQTASFILDANAKSDFLCSFSTSTTWAQWSGILLEGLHRSNKEFAAAYTWTPNETYTTTDGTTFNKVANNKFGEIVVKDDAATGEVNSVLNWTGDNMDLAEIYAQPNHSVTLYVQFKTAGTPASYVYVGITLTVSKDGQEANWTVADNNKYVPEWQNGEIHMHVAAPEAGNDVNDFYYELTNAWLNGNIGVTAAGAYNNNIKYSFRWSSTQDTKYSANGQTLRYNGKDIATLTAAGKVTYLDNDAAKELLNSGKMEAHGNVEIVATYGTCEIPFPNTYKFTVRFLRPLTMIDGSSPEFTPATAGGSRVGLGSLFNLQDWRGKAVTDYKNGKMEAVLDNGINLYDFYEIESIKVDLTKVMFQNGSNWEPITANKNANLNIESSDANVVTVAGTVYTIDASSVANVNTVELIYNSASQGVTSKYNLKIPVQLVYSWGTLEAELPAVVNTTIGQ